MPARRLIRKAERWFRKQQRDLPWRSTYDPYHVWVSEVMLQQTRMKVVLRYFKRFLKRFPTVARLAAAGVDEVTAAWSGLGYYRRARMLRDGAIAVRDRFGGALPQEIEALMTIPGIGRYTAGAIASIAYDRAAPIVDGNIARMLARLYGIAGVPQTWNRAGELVRAAGSPRIFNQALMEIGALICTPKKPRCNECPLRRECRAFATGSVEKRPRKKRAKSRALQIPLYIVTDRRGRILMRRESGPLMHGMFHLPHGNGSLLRGSRFAVRRRKAVGAFRHTVTNRRIEFRVFVARSSSAGRRSPYVWVDPRQLEALPHPSYVRKALQLTGIGKV